MEYLGQDRSRAERLLSLINHLLNVFILIVCLLLVLICVYVALDEELLESEASENAGLDVKYSTSDGNGIDFDALRAINPDIVAWIRIDGTNINFPVVRGKDNYNYLYHDYKDERSAVGSIFLDYRNDNFDDDYSVMYGHRMKGEYMFGSILRYTDASFFAEHRKGELLTKDAEYSVNIISYAKISAIDSLVYNLDKNRNGHNDDIVGYLFKNPKTIKDNSYKYEGEKLIVLSTCDSISGQYRNILLATIIER